MPISQITSASIAANTITSDDMSSTAQYYGFKNRIINGAMVIDQRNAGASQSVTSGSVAYTVDRWQLYSIGSTTIGQRISDGAGGFRYRMTGAAGNTNIVFLQRIESNNSYDLAGQTVTLSADLANSVLTTIGWIAYYANSTDNFGTINASPNTTVIAQGGITVSSTVNRYSVQISIPSVATTGLQIAFFTTSQTSGTFTVGNVQLEKGAVATSFDFRPIGTELMLCQRYYFNDTYTVSSGLARRIVAGYMYSSTQWEGMYFYPVEMRVSPTITFTAANTFTISGALTVSGIAGYLPNTRSTLLYTGNSAGTAGQGAGLWTTSTNGTVSNIQFSAEL